MGKRDDQSGYMDELLGINHEGKKGDTEGPQRGHVEATNRDTKGTQRGTMEIYKIRMYSQDYISLKQHFEAKGMKVTTGIRSIIMEYMKRQGL